MGQSLSKPITSLGITSGTTHNTKIAIVECQNSRYAMEDNALIVPSFSSHPENSLFGVFDGHVGKFDESKGDQASQYLFENLYTHLNTLPELTNQAISDALLVLDNTYITTRPDIAPVGSTVLLALLSPLPNNKHKLSVFNIGDSRAFHYSPTTKEFKKLSEDHCPNHVEERIRIKAAGGKVSENRVDGNLAMSRAFGDSIYKENTDLPQLKQKVIALADVTEIIVEEGDYIFLSCDGIYERSSWEKVFEHVRKYEDRMADKNEDVNKLVKEIAKSLVEFGWKNKSNDNMTSMVLVVGEFSANEMVKEYVPGEVSEIFINPIVFDSVLKQAIKFEWDCKEIVRLAFVQVVGDMPENIEERNEKNTKRIKLLKKCLENNEIGLNYLREELTKLKSKLKKHKNTYDIEKNKIENEISMEIEQEEDGNDNESSRLKQELSDLNIAYSTIFSYLEYPIEDLNVEIMKKEKNNKFSIEKDNVEINKLENIGVTEESLKKERDDYIKKLKEKLVEYNNKVKVFSGSDIEDIVKRL